MKVKWMVGSVIILMAGFMGVGCDDVLEDATTATVTAETEVYHGQVASGEPVTWALADNLEMKGGTGKTKDPGFAPAADKDHVWIPVNIEDRGLILQLLMTGGGSFSGRIENKENNPVIFGVYLSDTENLPDPRESAHSIATLTIPANGDVDLNLPENFDQSPAMILQSIAAFLETHPELTRLIVYFTADGDPFIDLFIPTMAMVYPPFTAYTNALVPGDLANYRKTIKEVTESKFAGKLTNKGEAGILFQAYLSLVTESYSTGNPAAADLVAEKVLAVGETVMFENVPDEVLVPGGAAKLTAGIENLINGDNLETNLFFRSMDPIKPIVAQMDSFKIESAASVGL